MGKLSNPEAFDIHYPEIAPEAVVHFINPAAREQDMLSAW